VEGGEGGGSIFFLLLDRSISKVLLRVESNLYEDNSGVFLESIARIAETQKCLPDSDSGKEVGVLKRK
jgi:hypothetical protein